MFEVQYMVYGSQDHSLSSHKSRIDLQTHIMCIIVTFPELYSLLLQGAQALEWRHRSIILLLNVQYWPYHMLPTIKEVKVRAVPLICPCKSHVWHNKYNKLYSG